MEKKMFLALALSMAVLIAWPFMFNNKDKKATNGVSSVETKPDTKEAVRTKKDTEQAQAKLGSIAGGQTYFIENSFIKIGVSSKGAVITQVIFRDYKDDKKEFIRFFGTDVEKRGAFYIHGLENTTFNVKILDQATIELYDGKGNSVNFALSKDSYTIDLSIKKASEKSPSQFSLYSKTIEPEDKNYGLSKDPDKRNKGMLLYSALQEKITKTDISSVIDKGAVYFNESFRWLALSDRYFMMAVLDKNNSLSDVSAKCISGGNCTIDFSVKGMTPGVFNVSLFAGPKDVTYMRNMDTTLAGAIDYGWLSFMSVPMLELMRFFYGIIPNYGVAILILTLLVRLLMFPLQHKAMKSMKRMQDLQPHLKGIQE